MKVEKIQQVLDKLIFPFILKPGRYLGNELNVVSKDISKIDIRFAIAFPEVYEIGMSSLGFSILYHLLNRIDYIWAERVFAPWVDMEERLRDNNLPLFSLESFSPLKDFDVIGFTLQYELTYTNILNMLDMASIPIWSKERSEDDPIIIAGGPCSCNPEPMAEFIDAFFIGDAEEGISELCQILREAKQEKISRKATLENIASIRGIYVPEFYDVKYDNEGNFQKIYPVDPAAHSIVKTQISKELINDYYPQKPLVPLIEVTHDRLAVEIMRGCTESCRFCNAGMVYRPVRERPVEDIVNYTQRALDNSGYDEASFLSLSTSDYSELSDLMQKEMISLEGQHVNVSFPSLRLDSFSEEIAEFARSVRKSGFTFAPEAGTDRLRKVINKNITEDDLIKSVTIALNKGWKQIKFYFMIGLPTETKEDIEGIAKLIEQIVHLSKKYGRIQFNVSISPFSPKSHTPFQWEKQNTKEEFYEKIDFLKMRLYRFKKVSLSWHDPTVSKIECILGRGDRRLAKVIYSAWKAGARFDGWSDLFRYNIWKEAFQNNEKAMDFYTQSIPEHLPLPWDHIDKGITKKFLIKERQNAYQTITINNCQRETCYSCGLQRKNGFAEFTDCYNPSKSNKVLTDVGKKIFDEGQTNKTCDSGSAKIFRIRFEKTGYVRYISHLDTMRCFDRAFRREKLNLVFSQGFNPRPKISFGPALPLGHSSNAEYMDIELISKLPWNAKDLINSFLPDGLQFLDIKEISSSVPSLTSTINIAEYNVNLEGQEISNESISNLLKQDSIAIIRRKKDKEKQIDIRPYIDSVVCQNGNLYIRTNIIKGHSVRINEILSILKSTNKEINQPLLIHRTSQFIKNNNAEITPLEMV